MKTPAGNPIVARWFNAYRFSLPTTQKLLIEELSDMTANWQAANEAITAVERERDAARADWATARGRVLQLLRELNAFKTGHRETT